MDKWAGWRGPLMLVGRFESEYLTDRPDARLPRDKYPRVDNDGQGLQVRCFPWMVVQDVEGIKERGFYVHSQLASLGSKISSTSIERLP